MFLRQGHYFQFGIYISKTICEDLTKHKAFAPVCLVSAGQGLEVMFRC